MIVIKASSRVKDGQGDAAVAAATAVRERSLKRSGVLGYDFFREDDTHFVVIEVYDGSETLLAHVEAGGFDDLFAVTEVLRIEAFGDPSPEVRALFASFGAFTVYPSVTH